MQYKMEELLPLVKQLTEKYTSKASTSVTYETARQLMGAVVYCIEETESEGEHKDAVRKQEIPAKEAYQMGYEMVVHKVRGAATLYNEIMESFHGYGNLAYQDTMIKSIPEFFKWYDVRFCPQETGIFLEYPVLISSGRQGIDEIYDYLAAIREEQKFLNALDTAYIQEALYSYHKDYRELLINLCHVVLKEIVRNILLEDPAQNISTERLEGLLKILINTNYQGNERMLVYLKQSIPDMITELRNETKMH